MAVHNRSISLVAIFLWAAIANVAHCQPVFQYLESLEWKVADSKVIVQATIVKIETNSKNQHTLWQTVTAKVTEKLKGDAPDNITFVVENSVYDKELSNFQKSGKNLILFLVDSQRLKKVHRRFAAHPLALRKRSWREGCYPLDGSLKRSHLMDMQFRHIQGSDTIIKRVQAEVKALTDKPAKPHTLNHAFFFLKVPIDRRLEVISLKLLKNKKADVFLRTDAAKALSRFRSDANIALFRQLLSDTSPVYQDTEDGEWVALQLRTYPIRRIAYTALKSWDEKVDKPVMEETVIRKETNPKQREAIKKIISSGGDVYYDPIGAAGKFRTVRRVYMQADSEPDMSPVLELTDLRELNLNSTRIKDLNQVAKLTNLRRLEIRSTPISDLSPIVSLKSLTSLQIDGTRVTDLQPVSKLVNLESITMEKTRITDLSPLVQLPKFHFLEASRSAVVDLSPLAKAKKLRWVDLRNTRVSNLESLSELTNLERLNLESSEVHDLSPLSKLTRLKLLDLSGTKVKDVSPLRNLKNLEHLDLDFTQVTDVSPLKDLPKIQPVRVRKSGGLIIQ